MNKEMGEELFLAREYQLVKIEGVLSTKPAMNAEIGKPHGEKQYV